MTALIYIFLCLVWGTTWLAMKIGLQDAPPLFAAAIRMLLASVVMWIIAGIRKSEYPSGWKAKFRISWPGLIIYGVSFGLTYVGMQYIDSGLGAVLFATLPFFVILSIPFILKSEKIYSQSIFGVIIGFVGIIVIFNGSISISRDSIMGAILFLIGSAFSGYFTVYLKAYLSKELIFPMLAMQFLMGAILLFLFSVFMENWLDFKVSLVSVGSILYLTIFGSVAAFGWFYWLLRRITAVQISLIAFITPVTALIVGYIFLDEQLGMCEISGSALVLAGVLLANIKKNN